MDILHYSGEKGSVTEDAGEDANLEQNLRSVFGSWIHAKVNKKRTPWLNNNDDEFLKEHSVAYARV